MDKQTPITQTAANQTDGLAIASLILSLLTFLIGPLGFIPGIICGHISRARIKKNPALSGDGFALAGIVIGYLFLIVFVLGVMIYYSLRNVSHTM